MLYFEVTGLRFGDKSIIVSGLFYNTVRNWDGKIGNTIFFQVREHGVKSTRRYECLQNAWAGLYTSTCIEIRLNIDY